MGRRPAYIRNRENGVPLEGDVAFSQGWTTKANPHSPDTPCHMMWISDWWRANAEAFRSHIYGHRENPDGLLGRSSPPTMATR